MGRRRGGSIYISTDPNNNVPIGTPGVGVAIGCMGTLIFKGLTLAGELTTEDGITLVTEDTGTPIKTEDAP